MVVQVEIERSTFKIIAVLVNRAGALWCALKHAYFELLLLFTGFEMVEESSFNLVDGGVGLKALRVEPVACEVIDVRSERAKIKRLAACILNVVIEPLEPGFGSNSGTCLPSKRRRSRPCISGIGR